jgi:hypothetical protein
VLALAVAGLRRAHPVRRPAALVAGVAVGWLVLFSASRGKAAHYAYPVYPMLAIALGAATVGVAGSVWPRRWSVAGTVLGVLVAADVAWVYARTLPRVTGPFGPWAAYQGVASEARARVVFYPERLPRKVQAQMQFYGMRMRGEVARTPRELGALLSDGGPALVYVWRTAKGSPVEEAGVGERARVRADASTFDVTVVEVGDSPAR